MCYLKVSDFGRVKFEFKSVQSIPHASRKFLILTANFRVYFTKIFLTRDFKDPNWKSKVIEFSVNFFISVESFYVKSLLIF